MVRSRRLRNYLKEVSESDKFEKLSLILPFLVLIVEIILIEHAIRIKVYYVIHLTSILLILSIIEILFIIEELHEHYIKGNFERILTIRLDDFILQTKMKNVKFIIEEFIEEYPEYKKHWNKLYHIACQILETHKEEVLEKSLRSDLKKFVKKHKRKQMRQIIDLFLLQHPKYKKDPAKIYHLLSQMLGVEKKKWKKFFKK